MSWSRPGAPARIIRLVGADSPINTTNGPSTRRDMSRETPSQVRIRLIEPDQPEEATRHSDQQPATKKTTRPTR